MSKAFNDPNLLTKDRLKRELESNGVTLPRVDQKKDFYVKLYRENLSPQAREHSSLNGGFSSDDDGDFELSMQEKQIVLRGSQSIKKAASKDIVSADIKSMTDEELKEELSALGSPVGPIMASTRGLYERKLARMRDNLPQNSSTTIITRSEFSDDNFDEEEVQDEESAPEDEFFSKRYGSSNRNGGNFGRTFTKNFQDTSTKKEVSRDFSVSSSRNVEKSSTFDRKTTNKVRRKKGDKFEENSWSTSTNNEEEDESGGDVFKLPGLSSNFQKALAAARYSPEKSSPATEVRARASQAMKSELIRPENIPETKDEKPKTKKRKTSRNCRWALFTVVLILIVFVAAVVYNFEELPALSKLRRPALPSASIAPKNHTE